MSRIRHPSWIDLEKLVHAQGLSNEALRDILPTPLDFRRAIESAGLSGVDAGLSAITVEGAIDWTRFDVTQFGGLMPSMAVLDRREESGDAPDYVYGFVGETINEVAQRSLRGRSLRSALSEPARDRIVDEYDRVLRRREPRASVGRVVISTLEWVGYVRFLYPVRHLGRTERVLLLMLFNHHRHHIGGTLR